MSNLDSVINKFLEFVSHLNEVFSSVKIFENINNESVDVKLCLIKKLNDAINTTTNFNYLLKMLI